MARSNMPFSGLFSILAVCLILSACASKDFQEPGIISTPTEDISRVFPANFQDTWRAVTQAASSMPLMTNLKESGTLITDWIKAKSDRLFSGYGETRIPYTIRYKFNIKVKPTSKGTMVTVNNKEQYLTDAVTSGIDFSGSIYQWLDTESSTQKEKVLLDEIGSLISPKK